MRISDWSSDVCSSDLPRRKADDWKPMSTDRSEFSTVLSQNIHDPSKGSGDRRQNRLCADQARRTADRESYRRSEERRVGIGGGSTSRTQRAPDNKKEKKQKNKNGKKKTIKKRRTAPE